MEKIVLTILRMNINNVNNNNNDQRPQEQNVLSY